MVRAFRDYPYDTSVIKNGMLADDAGLGDSRITETGNIIYRPHWIAIENEISRPAVRIYYNDVFKPKSWIGPSTRIICCYFHSDHKHPSPRLAYLDLGENHGNDT
jgi:hypothetical protein